MKGARIGPYRVLGDLGSGGMGKVYLAQVEGKAPGLDDGVKVALKVIHPHLLETPGFFKRFLREAEIGKSVEQANVVRCFDCDQLVVEGAHQNFLVMEYVEGQNPFFALEITRGLREGQFIAQPPGSPGGEVRPRCGRRRLRGVARRSAAYGRPQRTQAAQ